MTQEVTIKEELSKNANNAVSAANAMVVTDNPSNEEASIFVKNLKAMQKEISAELRPHIDQAHSLHKSLVAQEKRFLDPLKKAEKEIKSKITAFLVKMEEERQEVQRKAREKAAAEERKIREAKEKQQREWEAKEKAKRDEADRLEKEGKAEEARKAREVADKAAEKAEEREQQAQEAFVPAPIVESKIEQQKGVSTIQKWKFEVIDETKVPEEWKIVDEKAIGNIVRSMKDKSKLEKMIPGIRVWSESSVSVRA